MDMRRLYPDICDQIWEHHSNRNVNIGTIPFAEDEVPLAKSEDAVGNSEYNWKYNCRFVHGYKY
jgi:hypothetical protein